MNWAAVNSSDWLLIAPAGATGDSAITVEFDLTGLTPGIYSDTISVSDPNAANSPQTVAVTLTVRARIMPLAIGNRWVYNFIGYESGPPNPTFVYTYTLHVIDRVTIGDEVWYETLQIIDDDISPDTLVMYYINRFDGLWVRKSIDEADTAFMKIKFPANPGDDFTGYNGLMWQELPADLAAVDISVTVPYGTYQCYHYGMYPSLTVILNEYYRPEIGWINSIWSVFVENTGWTPIFIFELTGMELH